MTKDSGAWWRIGTEAAEEIIYYGPLARVMERDVEQQPVAGESSPEDLSGRIDAVHREIRQLRQWAQNVLDALPIKLLVLDANLRIIWANPAYYLTRGLSAEELHGKPLEEVFPTDLLEGAGLREALLATLRTGERIRWTGYRQSTPDHGERIVNIRVDPCNGSNGERCLLLTIEDVTERHRELYERKILQEITRAMLGQLELPRLLHAILTGMTAGGAVGLGFNRAVLLLADEREGVLRAVMAVGPESREQAATIWSKLANQHRTMEDFLADYDQLPPPEERPLFHIVERLTMPLSQTELLPMWAIAHRRTVLVEDAASDPRVSDELRDMLGVNEFVVAPLVAKGKTIGAAIADNFITLEPIGRADIQLLTVLADQAALAIDSARMYQEAKERATELDEAYRQLKEAHQQQVRTEKLAAIGKVTAIVAHEIRNPLSTVGGFARSIVRNPDNVERNARNAQIIVDEVQQLERIVADLLDFTKPRAPQLAPVDLRELITNTLGVLADEIQAANIRTRLELDQEPIVVSLDETLFRQVLINLFKNAIEAMPDGGTLTVGAGCIDGVTQLWVADTGCGIPEAELDDVFEPFYTTKSSGTGLGLAMIQQIVTDLGGRISVSSKLGAGTTFRIKFTDLSASGAQDLAAEPVQGEDADADRPGG